MSSNYRAEAPIREFAAYFNSLIATFTRVDRRRVVGQATAYYFVTESVDPMIGGQITLPAGKAAASVIEIGDKVIVVEMGGSYVIVDALPGPGT